MKLRWKERNYELHLKRDANRPPQQINVKSKIKNTNICIFIPTTQIKKTNNKIKTWNPISCIEKSRRTHNKRGIRQGVHAFNVKLKIINHHYYFIKKKKKITNQILYKYEKGIFLWPYLLLLLLWWLADENIFMLLMHTYIFNMHFNNYNQKKNENLN